jgi:HEAT repeat protein
MKKRVALGAAVFLLIVIAAVFQWMHEPRYQHRTLSSWLQQCADSSPSDEKQLQQAQAAVRVIGSERVLPRLLSLIRTRDTRLRAWLVEQSERFEERYFTFDSAAELQLRGFVGFEALGTNAAPAVGELSQLLGDKELAFVAALCLAQVGKPAEFILVRCLTNQNWHVRHLAVSELAAVTDDVEVYIDRIKPSLNDREQGVRFITVQAIGEQTHVPELAVPLLLSALGDADDSVMNEAALALAGLGTDAAVAFPHLTNLMSAGDVMRARAAARTLPAIAPAEAVTVLSNTVVNGDSAIVGAALRGLNSVAPELTRELTIAQLQSSESRRRSQAVNLVSDYPLTDSGITDALKSAASDRDPDIARRAQIAMRQMLQKQKETTHGQLVLAGEPACLGKSLGEWLAERQFDSALSTNAVAALHAMGTNAIPALLRRLQYREPVFNLYDPDVSAAAAVGLIALGEQARPAVPTLMALMDDSDAHLAALAMMAALGTGEEAGPCLVKGLTNRFADVRNEAVGQCIGDWEKRFPEQRKQAMPFLVKLLDDPDPGVRMNASNGLKYLDQEPPARVHEH